MKETIPSSEAETSVTSNESQSGKTKVDYPIRGYLEDHQIKSGVVALRKYMRVAKALSIIKKEKRDLLEAGEEDLSKTIKFFVEVVFKNVPSNTKTYSHSVVLPHHWRITLEPEDYRIALFVKHLKPETEALKIQFSKDRALDIDNTHTFYKELLEEKVDEKYRSLIARIISTKEVATEYDGFQKLDKLVKTYDLFLSDKGLMSNKMNALPRRLGRRFWVREKKIPLLIDLKAKDLNDQFKRVLNTEPFHVTGSSATERAQVGCMNQPDEHIVQNIRIFLDNLYELYGDDVRFIRFKSNHGKPLTAFADLNLRCKEVVMRKKKVRAAPAVDEFDFLPGNKRVSVYKDGSVKIIN